MDEYRSGVRAMESVSVERIEAQLRTLPPEKLEAVFDFVSYLAERSNSIDLLETMVASEPILAGDWFRPEEDEAWADL
jgi:hypothetical protein